MPYTHATAQWVVIMLGLIALACVIGSVVLVAKGHDVPPSLAAIGGAASGALGGHLGAMGMVRHVNNGSREH